MSAPVHTSRVNAVFDVLRKAANDSGYGPWITNNAILQQAYAIEAAIERFDPPAISAIAKAAADRVAGTGGPDQNPGPLPPLPTSK